MPVQNYRPLYVQESPFRVTPIIGSFMGYYVHRQINPQENDIQVMVDNPIYVERPDRLANDIYGNPDLWWVFGVRNGWQDLVYDLKLGIPMAIPQLTYIKSLL
jgi:hypothetical protein